MKSVHLLRTAAVSAALLLSACSTLPGGKGFSVTTGQLPPPPTDRQWPDASQDARNQRAQGMGLVAMPEMEDYLNGLLAKIKSAAGVPEWPGAVHVTSSSALEAYSTGAGNIYLSMGWLSSAESEDEIVAILSHEFGHVYLDYHQMESVNTATDQVATLAAVGVALARKAGSATGWSPVDSVIASYTLGKNVLVPAWGRQQEENADRFGATVSLALGYSYTQGFKAFLERQATWEAENAKIQAEARQRMLEQIKQAAADNTRKQEAAKGNNIAPLTELQASLNSGVAGASVGLRNGLDDIWKKLTVSHPDTGARLASLTEQVMPLMAGKPRPPAATAPWNKARSQRRSAALLKNYKTAGEAQQALQAQDYPRARKLAAQAASGPSATHALPLLTLSMAQAEPGARGSSPLDRNLASANDRAWQVYVLRANNLLGAGQSGPATKVMAQGFEYFRSSALAWPEAIRFYGQTQGWEQARKLAQECASRFASYASECRKAAESPAEQAEAKRRSEQKAQSLVDKLFK
ncbi:M48 family metalloprotease [Achromobacter insolitus]|uniref:M48 family metalloprotease n=1 Tax=Achromobacter insolitus TaxID=217204 RepID=UPI001EEDEEAD|nr:M48 family metalloprotease [Achromobacter insolitus]